MVSRILHRVQHPPVRRWTLTAAFHSTAAGTKDYLDLRITKTLKGKEAFEKEGGRRNKKRVTGRESIEFDCWGRANRQLALLEQAAAANTFSGARSVTEISERACEERGESLGRALFLSNVNPG